MNSYWIKNANGEYAVVEGAAERDTWVGVHGWTETEEPGPDSAVQTYIINPDVPAQGRVPFNAIAGQWEGRGFKPGPPLPVLSITEDPRYTDVAPATAPATPTKSTSAKGGTEKKES